MNLKQTWRNVRPKLVSGLIYRLVSLLGSTYRVTTVGLEEFKNHPGGKILSTWHGRSIMGPVLLRNLGYYALISHSRDGEMQNRIFSRFGFQTIRGSTGRGGMQALIESIRVLKKGGAIAFTPDGPRGPSGIIQPGIMKMAQKSGVPVFPATSSADRRWIFKSWDRYMVPKPFAKVYVLVAPPLYVPQNATEQELETVRQALETEMHRLEQKAEARFTHTAPDWHSPDAHRP